MQSAVAITTSTAQNLIRDSHLSCSGDGTQITDSKCCVRTFRTQPYIKLLINTARPLTEIHAPLYSQLELFMDSSRVGDSASYTSSIFGWPSIFPRTRYKSVSVQGEWGGFKCKCNRVGMAVTTTLFEEDEVLFSLISKIFGPPDNFQGNLSAWLVDKSSFLSIATQSNLFHFISRGNIHINTHPLCLCLHTPRTLQT